MQYIVYIAFGRMLVSGEIDGWCNGTVLLVSWVGDNVSRW